MNQSEEWTYYIVKAIVPIVWYQTMPLYAIRNNPIFCIYQVGEFTDPNAIPMAVNTASSDRKFLLPDGCYKPFSVDIDSAWKSYNSAQDPSQYAATLAQYTKSRVRASISDIYCSALYRINVS